MTQPEADRRSNGMQAFIPPSLNFQAFYRATAAFTGMRRLFETGLVLRRITFDF